MALINVVPPAVEPVSLAELKEFLRVDSGDTSNDAVISSLAIAARSWAEVYTQRRFITQTWQLSMDFFPGYIDTKLAGQKVSAPFVAGPNAILVGIRYAMVLPFPPIQTIETFTYQNANGQVTSMSTGPSTIASVTNSIGQPIQITTAAPHGLLTGGSVTIAGNDSLLTWLNGETTEDITILSPTTFLLNGTVGDGTSIAGGGTVTGYNYVLDLLSQPARLMPVFGQMWPVARVVANAVQIEYVCGYGDDETTIPEGIKTGIKLLTNYWYENRVPDESNIPMAVKAVLGPYRDLRF